MRGAGPGAPYELISLLYSTALGNQTAILHFLGLCFLNHRNSVVGNTIVWMSVPERPLLQAHSQPITLLGDGGTFKRWGLVEGLTSLGCTFQRIMDAGFFCFLAAVRLAVPFTTHSSSMSWIITVIKTMQ